MKRRPPWLRGRCVPAAFTLLELLVVMSLMVMLLALVTMPLRSLLVSQQLTGTGNQIAALIERGRIHATTTQKVASMRFYADPETGNLEKGYRVVCVMEMGGGAPKAISRNFRLDDSILLNTSRSSALSSAGVLSGTGSVMGKSAVPYVEFYFFPNGTTSLEASVPNPYLTLVGHFDEQSLDNPFVISLDPVTARVTVFRR